MARRERTASPRIVAELGRPETPEETADRKAESSRVYRASQNTRNLVAALIVTLVVVTIIMFGVVRGTPPERGPIDVAAVAAEHAEIAGRELIVPDVPDEWRVNAASVEGDTTRAWTVVYAPEKGFLRVAQGLDADPAWPVRVLSGAGVDETITIGGVEWERFDIRDPSRAGNISGALATNAGPDTVLVYGAADDATLETAAAGVAAQVLELREAAR